MSKKDTPLIKVNIELDSYEIANLFAALEMVPDTGDWYQQIIGKIHAQMLALGYKPEEFYFHPNAGMNPRNVRRHLDIMAHREKYKNG
jgi:hypothetical protein